MRSTAIKNILEKGIKFNEYLEMTSQRIERTNPNELSADTLNKFEFTKLNIRRTERILKSYKPDVQLVKLIMKIEEPQVWMVLTEDWCGDSAQNLPYIAKFTGINDKIDLRIILRDSNPEIMDQFLTNGTRSIPKVVVFNSYGDEMFQWGPRPEEAKNLVAELKASGLTKDEFTEKLHLWYGRNRGKTLEEEFKDLLSREITAN